MSVWEKISVLAEAIDQRGRVFKGGKLVGREGKKKECWNAPAAYSANTWKCLHSAGAFVGGVKKRGCAKKIRKGEFDNFAAFAIES